MEATHETIWHELADQIVQKHRAYAKQHLPRLTALAVKVRSRHAYMYPELHQLLELVEAIDSEMRRHILKQEQVLSPRLFAMGQVLQPVAVQLEMEEAFSR